MPIVCVAVLRTTAWYFLSIKSTLVQNSIFFILYCQLLHILWDCNGYLKWTLDQYDIWWNWCGPKHGVKWHSMATWWSRDPNQGFKSNAEKGRQLHSCEEDIELCMSWKISALILLLAMSSQREHIGIFFLQIITVPTRSLSLVGMQTPSNTVGVPFTRSASMTHCDIFAVASWIGIRPSPHGNLNQSRS